MDDFYFVYVLLSQKDNKYYVGYSANLMQRINQHNKGLVQSTKHRRPLKLLYYEACLSQKDALHREKYLKTYYGKMFLKNRLKFYFSNVE